MIHEIQSGSLQRFNFGFASAAFHGQPFCSRHQRPQTDGTGRQRIFRSAPLIGNILAAERDRLDPVTGTAAECIRRWTQGKGATGDQRRSKPSP